MKCPLLKTIDYALRSTSFADKRINESFLPCIEAECMAWSKERQTCNHFNPDNKKIVEFKL